MWGHRGARGAAPCADPTMAETGWSLNLWPGRVATPSSGAGMPGGREEGQHLSETLSEVVPAAAGSRPEAIARPACEGAVSGRSAWGSVPPLPGRGKLPAPSLGDPRPLASSRKPSQIAGSYQL